MSDELLDAITYSTTEEGIKEQLDTLLPNAGRVFNFHTALDTVRAMDAYLRKPELYQLNDYHYLLLYDALLNLCDLHNEAIKDCETEEDRIQLSQIGDYLIRELLFDEMVDIYFFDTDFLLNPDDAFNLGMQGRNGLNVSEETFHISQGFAPHPEELELKEYEGEAPAPPEASPYFGSKSKVYPDFDYKINSSAL